AFLRERREADPAGGEDLSGFTADDYRAHLDGLPRFVGIRAFLAARGIALPEGEADDDADAHTVRGLGRRKNARFHALLEEEGAGVWDDAVAALARWRRSGLPVAIVSG